MQESVAAGEWISTWLSPVAYFLLDVALAVLFLAALKLSLNALHRVRSKRP